MNILVLAGGYSAERDVSLASGMQVAHALRSCGHRALLLDPYKSIEPQTSFQALYDAYAQGSFGGHAIPSQEPDLAQLKKDFGDGDAMLGRHVLEACKLADVVFLALHGSFGENGQLQATLDLHGIRYTGSGYMGCMLSMDKAVAKTMMEAVGVNTPPAAMPEDAPVVVKPANGGSSLGVTIARSAAEAYQALQHAGKYDRHVLVEKYVAGREFSVGVLDGKALPVIEIRPKNGWFDYANKYQADATEEICPAPIPEETATRMQDMALRAHVALRLGDYSRVDFIVDGDGEIFCLEANSLPGLSPASLLPKEARAIDISYDDLCEKIVQLALERKD